MSKQEDSPLPEQTVAITIEMPTIGVEISEVRLGDSEWAIDIINYLKADKLPVISGKLGKSRIGQLASSLLMGSCIGGVLYK